MLERCQPRSKCETTLWALEKTCLGNSGFYSIGGLFPNHWDPVFHSIVDYLLEAVASMRLGFNLIGVGGEVVGNNIVNTV